MCGRFSITKQEEDIEKRFGADFYSKKFEPEFNVYPSKYMPVLHNEDKKRFHFFHWGFSYAWSKSLLINSRSDKLAGSNFYKRLFQKQRCLIPADGFYEWQVRKSGNKKFKIPHRIRL